AFSNINLFVGAVLPFDGSPARFRSSLSTRYNPFTITYLPFGGSGFFAIEANAHGIVVFEAGFEFGGSAAFGFGALSGVGRLMSGFYITVVKLDDVKATRLLGTFFAGGAASILCFSF